MKPGHQNLDFEDNDDKISIEAERESDDTLKITITTSEAFRGISNFAQWLNSFKMSHFTLS